MVVIKFLHMRIPTQYIPKSQAEGKATEHNDTFKAEDYCMRIKYRKWVEYMW